MVKTYSLKADGNTKLSKNFSVREFACKDGSDTILIDSELVEILQKIRDHFNTPVIITSAYRHKEYNKKIGGVSNSRHIRGEAADIYIEGVEPEKIAQYAEYIMSAKGGIGCYSNFVHADVRPNKSRWVNYGSEKVVSGFPGYDNTADSTNNTAMTSADAVAILTAKGIITNPDIWYRGTWKDNDFKELIIKTAKHLIGESKT